MAFSLTYPYVRSTGSIGFLESTNTVLDAIKSSLKNLISTNWGERYFSFTFGWNLAEFLFENKTENLKEKIIDRGESQTRKWMPFLTIKSINVFFESDDKTIPDNGIGVLVHFEVTSQPDLNSVVFATARV